jgi:hypothetical protein
MLTAVVSSTASELCLANGPKLATPALLINAVIAWMRLLMLPG